MQDSSGVEVIEGGTVTLVDAPNGEVSYQWQAGDTDESGVYYADFKITFGGGTVRTSPNPGAISIIVSSSIRSQST